jgi:hypothetical protein
MPTCGTSTYTMCRILSRTTSFTWTGLDVTSELGSDGQAGLRYSLTLENHH